MHRIKIELLMLQKTGFYRLFFEDKNIFLLEVKLLNIYTCLKNSDNVDQATCITASSWEVHGNNWFQAKYT